MEIEVRDAPEGERYEILVDGEQRGVHAVPRAPRAHRVRPHAGAPAPDHDDPSAGRAAGNAHHVLSVNVGDCIVHPSPPNPGACLGPRGLAVSAGLAADGSASVRATGDPAFVPMAVSRSADGRELTLTTLDARLAGRDARRGGGRPGRHPVGTDHQRAAGRASVRHDVPAHDQADHRTGRAGVPTASPRATRAIASAARPPRTPAPSR